ncbi:MAG: DUF4199 domain-containing protein [Nibricoccus sp.]
MRSYFNNGILIAGCNALFTLALYLGGFQTDLAKIELSASLSLSFSVALTTVVLVRSVRSRRILTPPTDPFPFGLALGIATTISLVSAISWAVFQFIYLRFINTDYIAQVIEAKVTTMQANGKSPAEIEVARQSLTLTPAAYVAIEFLLGTAINVIISLIIAAVMRRKAVEDLPASPSGL